MNAPAAPVRSVVIVGGGTAGWMSAMALAKALPRECCITLVESEEIGTVGVGEATIPAIRTFNQAVGLDEDVFLRATRGTFKLGIEFVNWGGLGQRYIHGFGAVGQPLGLLDFYPYWQAAWLDGQAPDLENYSLARMACRAGRFMRPLADRPQSPLGHIAYAFHFDASLYARHLRGLAEGLGVQRIEGRVERVSLSESNGFVSGVDLADGRRVEGQLFLDCSGFRGLLIEQTLKTGFADWSHWLPCDRAWAVPCAPTDRIAPYTRSTAHRAGWQWRIPLQHRTGNGHVYCSQFLSDDEAAATLLGHLDGEPLAEPRLVRFTTGMRRKTWNRNVVAIGLSGGFLEPLESTSIHLIQTAISKLVTIFPDTSFSEADSDEFNAQMEFEFTRIRDFIILHYHLNKRTDAPFWSACRNMDVPLALQRRIALYARHGRIFREAQELFTEAGWLQVMHGQGLHPAAPHPLVGTLSPEERQAFLHEVARVIRACVDVMPEHRDYIKHAGLEAKAS